MPHHKAKAETDRRQPAPQTAGKVIRWARFYDAVTWLMSLGRAPAIRKMTVDLAQVAPGEKVLDVGCGTGTLTIAAKAKAGAAGEAHGIDAAPEMIEVARRKAARAGADVDFQAGLIESIPFPDDEFDLVLSSLMLHHLPDDLKRRGFAEIHRVLKPGGRFLAVDFSSTGGSPLGHILTVLTGHGAGHGTTMAGDYPSWLGDAGFTSIEVGRTKYKPLWFVRGTAEKGSP